ncbi:MAG: hypothetical protein ACKOYM_07695 [Actinomycetes bacterium]
MTSAVVGRSGGVEHHRGRIIGVAAAGVVLVVLAFPLRNLLAQRAEIARTRDRVAELTHINGQLRDRLRRAGEQGELGPLVQRQLNKVEIGEESYAILPPATAGVVLPNTWPFNRIAAAVASAAAG